MTIKEIKQLIDQLIKEDVNGNRDLINFYQNKVQTASQKAFPRAYEKAINGSAQ